MQLKSKLVRVKSLIQEWSQHTDQRDRLRSKMFCHEASSLFRQLDKFDQVRQNRNLKTAEGWNPFRILRVGHQEAKLHTPFLRELMDCHGSHGQGAMFFRAFLKQLSMLLGGPAATDLASYVPTRFQSGYVSREGVFDRVHGIMDIVVERRFGENAFCVIIENKIGASEQLNQLQRYFLYLNKHPATRKRRFLVYLHPRSEKHEPVSGKHYLNVRYQDQIGKMLLETSNNVGSQSVRQALAQYLAIIDEL